MSTSETEPARCGFVAIIGAPNAGKSTLLNRIAGTKLSIVSPKAQTTRFRIMGILMRGAAQILLVDTPGIFQPKRRLDRAMVAAAWTGMQDADLTVLLVDAKAGLSELTEGIIDRLARAGREVWLVLNKTDLVEPARLLPLISAINGRLNCTETFMVSATTGEGVQQLRDALAAAMPEGPHLYPEEDLTDLPDRLLAAEIVREQILLQTHQEVPHETTVETESFTERKDGSRIKEIGAKARLELTKLFDRKVHLFLTVKERAGWDEKAQHLRALGLDG
jgi:GTP-binding protein Era